MLVSLRLIAFPVNTIAMFVRVSPQGTAPQSSSTAMSHSAADGPIHRNLPMLLLRAREKMMERFRPLLTANGLTEQQWRVIRALDENGSLEPRQISDLCTISSPSMAGVLARMEAMGLITKERFLDDQRRVRVSMTKKSANLVRVLSKDLEKQYRLLEQQVGRDVVAAVYGAVDALLAGLEDA